MGSWITKVVIRVGDTELELTKEQFMELDGEVKRLTGELEGELLEILGKGSVEADVSVTGHGDRVVGGSKEPLLDQIRQRVIAVVSNVVSKVVRGIKQRIQEMKKEKQE